MSYKYLKLAAMWMRILLLSISLFACATFVLWQFGGSWVDRLDTYIVSNYQEYYEKRLSRAVTTILQDPSQGVVLLEELLIDLVEVSKRDRLERLKRMSYEKLVQTLEMQGENEYALVWAERWVAFDELDLFAQLQFSRLLYGMPDREEEGRTLLESLYKKVPESSLIAGEYAERLLEGGDAVSAFLVASRTYSVQDSLSGQFWQVFWDTGKGFNAKQKMDVFPLIGNNGHLSFPVELPVGVYKLRVDPPIASRIVILKPILIRINGSQERILNLWEVSLGLSDMTQQGAMLTTSGRDDPYFYWKVPLEMAGIEVFSGRFEARIEESYPEIMGRIAALPEASTFIASFEAMGETEAMRQLQMIRNRKR